MTATVNVHLHNPQPDSIEIGGSDGSLWLAVGPLWIHVGGEPDEMLQQARALRTIATHAADLADQLTARIVAADVTAGWDAP